MPILSIIKNLSIFTTLVLFCLTSQAVSDKKIKSQIIKKIKITQKILKSKKSNQIKLKAISQLKSYSKNKSAKNSGATFRWIEGFKLSLSKLSTSDLKQNKCANMRHNLFMGFALNSTSPKDLPPYAQQTYLLLKAYCKKF